MIFWVDENGAHRLLVQSAAVARVRDPTIYFVCTAACCTAAFATCLVRAKDKTDSIVTTRLFFFVFFFVLDCGLTMLATLYASLLSLSLSLLLL